MAGAAPAAQVKTSGGKPAVNSTPAPKAPVAAKVSPAVHGAQRGGGPALTLGTGGASAPAIDVQPPEPIVAQLAPDEIDLSTGELAIPEEAAAAVKEGGNLDAKVRLPGLAEGTLYLRKRGTTFNTFDNRRAILLRHPALKRFAAVSPMVLVLDVKENKVGGWVGLGTPGSIKGHQDALKDALTKGSDLLGWAGLSNLTLSKFHNRFEGGAIDVGVNDIKFKLGGFVSGSATAALDNTGLSFAGGAAIQIPGGSGEIAINRDATGALSGKAAVTVKFGSAGGTIQASLSRGFFNVMGTVSYSSDRLSGSITICAIDETTAREITRKKPEGGGVPIEVPGPDTPVKPGNRAFCGWGNLDFKVNDWLTGTAMVVVNNVGQATVVGKIAPPKEFRLFDKKPWRQKIFKFEVKAGYGIPVVGQVGIFASIGLDAVAEVGPGILKDITLDGAYSTDPQGPRALSLAGTINISAFAGLELDAKAGLFVTILSHDIKAGVTVTAKAGVRGYVQATPRIGMREPTPGKREYFIQGHMEIAAEPILAFAGSLEVSIDTPWWSPLSDKTWTWPLGELVYPLPGEFGIGADVDYVLGSKKWPEIEWGEVDFDGEKFLGDLMNDNTDKGRGGDKKEAGDWEEGLSGKGPGGAKNKGGSGKTPQDPNDDIGPIGQDLSFSDGVDQHELSIEEKPGDAEVMVASKKRPVAEDARDAKLKEIPELPVADRPKAVALSQTVITDADKANVPAKDLAIKKQAARNIKAIAAKEGRKGRKKGGKGKKDIKAELKLAKVTEKELLVPVKEEKTLLARVPFEPVSAKAVMAEGNAETLHIVADGGTLRLMAGASELRKLLLRGILQGPIGSAKNPRGRDIVNHTLKSIAPVLDDLAKIRVTKGMILRRQAERLPGLLAKVTGPVATLGSLAGLLAPSLPWACGHHRTARKKIEFVFFAVPGKKLQGRIAKEMQQQLERQESGLNKLTVDTFIVNADTYRSDDAKYFQKLKADAKLAVIDELKERALAESARAGKAVTTLKGEFRKLIRKSDEAQEEASIITRKIADSKARTTKAAAERRRMEGEREKAEETRGLAEQEASRIIMRGFFPIKGRHDLASEQRAKKLANRAQKTLADLDLKDSDQVEEAIDSKELQLLTKRHDNLDQIRQRHAAALEALRANEDLVRRWEGMEVKGKSVMDAILHDPDQCVGGKGMFDVDAIRAVPHPGPKPTQEQDREWKAYLKEVEELIGAQYVNQMLGGFAQKTGESTWKKPNYAVLRKHAESQVPISAAYGLWMLNVNLPVTFLDPPKGKK